MLNKDYLGKYDFLLITLDSLCYKTTVEAATPNINKYGQFRKVYSQATYTFPSHCSMFQGVFPDNRFSDEKYYNRKLFRIFAPGFEMAVGGRKTGIVFPKSSNIIKGFEMSGYRTIGLGGVGWFDNRRPTTSIWRTEFFNEFYYKPEFHEVSKNSINSQIECLKNKLDGERRKVFSFINISATHAPYQGQNQKFALEKFDKHFPEILNIFKQRGNPLFIILVSDHGDVLNQNWTKYQQRHAFFLDNQDGLDIMEVPMLVIDLPNGVE